MPVIAPVRPRQKLPPPTTTATSTPRFSRMSRISNAVLASVAPSRPEPDGPANASPDGLKTIRFHRGFGTAVVIARSADLDLSEPEYVRRSDQLLDRDLVVFRVRLVEQTNVLE